MNRNIKQTLLHLPLLAVVLLFKFDTGAQSIVQIASDHRESYFVKSDGSLWRGDIAHAMAKGKERMQRLMNEMKQHPNSPRLTEQFLGNTPSDNFEPIDLIVSNGVTAVALNGQKDAFFIKNNGSLWAVGNNEGGYFGGWDF